MPSYDPALVSSLSWVAGILTVLSIVASITFVVLLFTLMIHAIRALSTYVRIANEHEARKH